MMDLLYFEIGVDGYDACEPNPFVHFYLSPNIMVLEIDLNYSPLPSRLNGKKSFG